MKDKHAFRLYWSPEGKPIDVVLAHNERDAVRKAPKPYRRYMGEIYAVQLPHAADDESSPSDI